MSWRNARRRLREAAAPLPFAQGGVSLWQDNARAPKLSVFLPLDNMEPSALATR